MSGRQRATLDALPTRHLKTGCACQIRLVFQDLYDQPTTEAAAEHLKKARIAPDLGGSAFQSLKEILRLSYRIQLLDYNSIKSIDITLIYHPGGCSVLKMRIEWPTIGLAALIYGGWAVLTLFSTQLPAVLSAMLGAWLIAWHSSLQHELLHGHPTSCSRLNHMIGFVPLSLWLPYSLYRASHLAHHRAGTLTDPLIDPESYYWTPQSWANIGPLGRRLVYLQTTLLGRLLIGPAWNAVRLFKRELARGRNNLCNVLTIWAMHLIGCVALLNWIVGVCGMSPYFYIFAIVYPGTSLSLIRSFVEHRAAQSAAERTAIVENAWILGLLFLFNNLHVVHHERPDLPWYKISAWYKKHREALIAANVSRVYDGYFDVARQFLFKPHDVPIHPFVS